MFDRIGHFGRIGPFQLYVPPAAKNLTQELGLMLFLAGAGTNAGAHLVDVRQDLSFWQDWSFPALRSTCGQESHPRTGADAVFGWCRNKCRRASSGCSPGSVILAGLVLSSFTFHLRPRISPKNWG